jgi:hypothetical protein
MVSLGFSDSSLINPNTYLLDMEFCVGIATLGAVSRRMSLQYSSTLHTEFSVAMATKCVQTPGVGLAASFRMAS